MPIFGLSEIANGHLVLGCWLYLPENWKSYDFVYFKKQLLGCHKDLVLFIHQLLDPRENFAKFRIHVNPGVLHSAA